MKKSIWCDTFQQFKTTLLCPSCPHFPCRQVRPMLDKFHDSPLFNREFKGLNKLGRQRKIAIMKDGSLREFKKPTLKMDKVFQVQEYEMEYQLILKPKKERQEIEHGKE